MNENAYGTPPQAGWLHPECRGAVTGEDWRRSELQERYGDHWVPALLRLIERYRSNSPPEDGSHPLQ